ncbi:MAG: hypothetical protein V3V62_06375 [bacterium]
MVEQIAFNPSVATSTPVATSTESRLEAIQEDAVVQEDAPPPVESTQAEFDDSPSEDGIRGAVVSVMA